MKRFIIPFILCTAFLFPEEHSSVRILDYRVEASIDEEQSEVAGIVSVWLQFIDDGIGRIRFRIPSNIEINAVRDIDDDRFSQQRSPDTDDFFVHTLSLPAERNAGDSVFIKIEFEGTFDSSSHSPQFINQREFLLRQQRGTQWLPQFETNTSESIFLSLTTATTLRVIGARQYDSVSIGDGKKTWYMSAHSHTALHDFFTLCGSTALIGLSKQSPDSLTVISFFIDSSRFHYRFADSLLAFLTGAAQYFNEMTDTAPQRFNHTFTWIGEANNDEQIIPAGGTIIGRNSPAYSIFDSSVFVRSTKNEWLVQLARRFSLSHNDSTALFDHGWAGYLATQYIVSRFPSAQIERRERLDLMINALSFFPTYPLAAGTLQRANEEEVLSYKGRYFFLMLDQLLGSESFKTVVKKMYAEFSKDGISIDEFQLLCEREYGSTLDWFFRQWLYRSSAPEYTMQWNSERTQRGPVVVKLTIEQRGEIFTMPLTMVFTLGAKKIPKRILVEQFRQEYSFTFNGKPSTVEIDPNLSVLRWLLDIRILAHARSSRLFRVYNKDISSAEREAQITLDLDPANATGSAPIAYFSLGKLAVLEKNLDRAKEHFLKAMQSGTNDESSLYPLLGLIRYGNILEMEGRRNEAIPLYQRAANEGRRKPSLFAPAIIEAEKYLRRQFVSSDEFWYGIY